MGEQGRDARDSSPPREEALRVCPGNWEGRLSCELDLRGSCGHLPVSSEGRRPPGLWGGGGGGPPAVRRVQGLRGRVEGGGDR